MEKSLKRIWEWLGHIHLAIWLLGIGLSLFGWKGVEELIPSFPQKHPHAFQIIVEISVMLLVAALAGAVARLLQPKLKFELLSVYFRRATSGTETFPSKIRIVLQNQTKEILQVNRAAWKAGYGDLRLQDDTYYRFQGQPNSGWQSGQWLTEGTQIQVHPGKAFCVTLAADPSVSDTSLGHRLLRDRLGTLVLSARISNVEQTIEIRCKA
jgi:hypothetical protein